MSGPHCDGVLELVAPNPGRDGIAMNPETMEIAHDGPVEKADVGNALPAPER